MKTVTFRHTDLRHRHPAADKEEKEGGIHSGEMTTGISSPSTQTWLENFDADQDSLLDYFLNGEQDESNNTDAMDVDVGKKTRPTGPSYDSILHQTTASFKGPKAQCDDTPNPPPSTPAVQFYADVRNKSSHQRCTNSDVSTSSVSVLPQQQFPAPPQGSSQTSVPQIQQHHPAITFPVECHSTEHPASTTSLSLQGLGSTQVSSLHRQFKAQAPTATPYTVSSMSPISPAVMCTNEVLMLPSNAPPSRQNANTATNRQEQQPWQNNANAPRSNFNSCSIGTNMNSAPNPPMQLPAWLQHMNNVASLASQAGSSSGVAMSVQAPLSVQTTQPLNHNLLPNAFPNQPQHQQPHPLIYQATSGSSSSLLLPIPGAVMAMQQRINLNSDSASETKEKREKRLARNRESARQSRRRKKELLLNLRKQVNELHDKIGFERRKIVESMEHEVAEDRIKILNEIFVEQIRNGQSAAIMDRFISTTRKSGPNTKERRAATIYQYNSLRKLVLPLYRQIFLSMSLKDRNFLICAKERMTKETQKTTGRISSKLVGEDITKKNGEMMREDQSVKTHVTCSANDKFAFWPLLCYELSIGIEQEEKFAHAFDTLRMSHDLPETRYKIAAVATMITHLKESVISHSTSVGNKNELALLQILTPAQSLRFLGWFLRNKSRCSRLVAKEKGFHSCGHNMTKATSDHSLSDFCKQLTNTMSIKKMGEDRDQSRH